MTPSFLTPEYIEACRAAEHIQGWWTATWPGDDVALKTVGGPFSGELRTMRMCREAHYPWALPAEPQSAGLQTNVRRGDWFYRAWPGWNCSWREHVVSWAYIAEENEDDVAGAMPAYPTRKGDVVVQAGRLPARSLRVLAAPAAFDDPVHSRGAVFLPRLDQILWLASVDSHPQLGGIEPSWMRAGLVIADANLARLGCPRRTP